MNKNNLGLRKLIWISIYKFGDVGMFLRYGIYNVVFVFCEVIFGIGWKKKGFSMLEGFFI